MHGQTDERLSIAMLAERADFHVGDLLVSPSRRLISGAGGAENVEPLVMQLLVVLADAGGAVVTRDQLMRRCWGQGFVADDSLNRVMGELRRVLRAVAATDAAIETVPRTGYRLVGDVVPVKPPAGVDTGAADADMVAGNGHARRAILLGGGVAVAAGGFALASWMRGSRPDPEVERLIAKGDQAMRLADPRSDRQAVGHFEQAAQLAPDDARVWGRLALARQSAAQFAPLAQADAARAASEAAAGRALELDPKQPDALSARALMLPQFGEWARAERALRQVLAIAPDHLPTLDRLALLLAGAGLLAAHYPLRLQTLRGDPFHCGYNFRSIYSHWMNGQLAAADRAGERGLEVWPHHFATWYARTTLFAFTGRAERARAMLADDATRPPIPPPMSDVLRTTWTALDSNVAADRAAARDLLLRAVDSAGPVMAVNGSMMLAALGETTHALDVAEAYLLERGPIMTGTAWRPGQPQHIDLRGRLTNHLFLPVTAPMRADPRFAPMMRDIGLADYWRGSGQRPDYLGNRPLPA